MNNFKTIQLFLLSLLLSSFALAAENVAVITWQQAVTLAQKNNPDLISARDAVAARTAQYKGTYSGLFPRLTVSNSYTTGRDHNPDTRWQANGTAAIDLFNAARYADIQTASASLDQAQANLRQVTSDLLLSLEKAFAQQQFAQQQVQVAKTIQEIRDRNARLVTLRYESGRESRGNMLRAKAEALQAETQVNQSQRDLVSAQQELIRQIGQTSFMTIVATGTIPLSSAQKPQSFEEIVEHHPLIQLQEAGLATAQAQLESSRSTWWPTLSASYTRSYQGPSYFPENSNWSAAGTVSIPLLSGGLTAPYYAVSAARRNIDRAKEDIRSARNQLQSELEQNWSALEKARDDVRVQSAFLEAARQRNGEADVRYSSGLLSYEEWELIVTDRVNFEQGLIRAERDSIVADAQWMSSSGKELGD